MAIARIGDTVLRVPAVDGVAGEERSIAEILATGRAIVAGLVAPSEPWDAHALSARLDDSRDLMARNERQLRLLELAVDDVKVGPADGTRFDPDQDLALLRPGHRDIDELERFALPPQDHCAHEVRVARRSSKSTRCGFLACGAAAPTPPQRPRRR